MCVYNFTIDVFSLKYLVPFLTFPAISLSHFLHLSSLGSNMQWLRTLHFPQLSAIRVAGFGAWRVSGDFPGSSPIAGENWLSQPRT